MDRVKQRKKKSMTNAVKTTHNGPNRKHLLSTQHYVVPPPLLCVLLVLILPMAGTLPRIAPTDKEGGVFNNCSRAMNVACPGCCGLEEDDACASSSSGPLNCIFISIVLNTCVVTTLLSGSVLCFWCFFWFLLFFFWFLPDSGGR